MKVTTSSSTSSTKRTSGAKKASAGFSKLIPDNGPINVAAPQGVSNVTEVAAVDGLLALQADGDGKSRALRKGRRMLEALDRLQIALLGDGPTQSNLGLLKRALAEERMNSGDKGLDETLSWAEVRVAVEAAKLERKS